MPIHKGSLSICRYKLLHDRKINLAKLNQLILDYQAGPLRLTGSTRAESVAWVCPVERHNEGLGEQDYWDMTDGQIDGGFILKMRVERRKVSSSLLQHVYKSRMLAKTKKKKKPLTRPEQKQLREDVEQELLLKTLPTISFCEAFWNTDQNVIYLFSTAKKMRELFLELFNESFVKPLEADIIAIQPPLMGLDLDARLDSERIKKPVEKIESTLPLTALI